MYSQTCIKQLTHGKYQKGLLKRGDLLKVVPKKPILIQTLQMTGTGEIILVFSISSYPKCLQTNKNGVF